MSQKVKILGVAFDPLNREELTKKLNSMLDGDGRGYLVTPNPEILMRADADGQYRRVLNGAALSIADGVGVVWAAKKLGADIRERIPGVEIGEQVLSLCAEKGIGVYFLGGKEGIAEEAAKKMQAKYRGLNVAGTSHGYFDEKENEAIVWSINESKANVLFVCMGSPRQEKWIAENISKTTAVRLALALGGSLDVYSGKVRRAPPAFRRIGAEWLWRSFSSFERLRRSAKLSLFIIRVLREKTRRSDVGHG